jgi:hypothetical protein
VRVGITASALLLVMRAVSVGNVGPEADRHHAEGVLRILGLTAEDAAEVAQRPLPSAQSPRPNRVNGRSPRPERVSNR